MRTLALTCVHQKSWIVQVDHQKEPWNLVQSGKEQSTNRGCCMNFIDVWPSLVCFQDTMGSRFLDTEIEINLEIFGRIKLDSFPALTCNRFQHRSCRTKVWRPSPSPRRLFKDEWIPLQSWTRQRSGGLRMSLDVASMRRSPNSRVVVAEVLLPQAAHDSNGHHASVGWTRCQDDKLNIECL